MIGFNIDIVKSNLENTLHTIVLENHENLVFTTNGLDIELKVFMKPIIDINDKIIKINLPLQFKIIKDAALFSLQSHGSLFLNLKTEFDISPNLTLSTKTKIVDYVWLDEPKIDFGALGFDIEKLVGMIIDHHKDSLSTAIDSSIRQQLNLKQLAEKATNLLKEKLKEVDFRSIKLYAELSEILLEPIQTNGDLIQIKGALRTDLACGVTNNLQPTDLQLKWVQSLLSDNISYIDINITEEIISDMLCDYINSQEYGGKMLVSTSCTVDFKPSKVSIEMNLVEPIKAVINIDGSPRYNEHEEKLYVENLSVNVNAAGFLYKLSAPLLNKFLSSKIQENLPIDIDTEIKKNLGKYFKGKTSLKNILLSHTIEDVSISKMQFTDQGVNALIKITDIEAKVMVQDLV